MTFAEVLRARRSVRGFERGRLVPEAVLRDALEIAQLAPSNCNVQPWRVFLASGVACDRTRAALCAAFDAGDRGRPEDPVDAFPGDYHRLQVECALELYRAMGIGRGDVAGRARAMRRNFELFDAPHVAVLCMEARFGIGVALDVGIYLQSLMLALASHGVASCPQASLRNYPHVLRPALGIPDTLRILCGLSFGYAAPGVGANRARRAREPLERNVVLVAS